MHLLHKSSSCKIWFVQMLCSTQMSTKKLTQKKESQWNHHTSLLRSTGSTSSGTDEDAKRPKVLLLMGLKYSSTVMRKFKTKMQKKWYKHVVLSSSAACGKFMFLLLVSCKLYDKTGADFIWSCCLKKHIVTFTGPGHHFLVKIFFKWKWFSPWMWQCAVSNHHSKWKCLHNRSYKCVVFGKQ